MERTRDVLGYEMQSVNAIVSLVFVCYLHNSVKRRVEK